ncbi:protein misato 1 [Caerostris extrusa]|uniref:Protein misato 1 n=1 Tax=Caerostris extrusa TaxID=172846 RepID=A0AAV4NBA2_CAEEX|nr:protein misato 1 [Caerostris extrusa]
MIEDAVRRMSEECDYLQGFHVLFDAHNGFSGITNNILQYLDDEYKRIPSLCFPVFQNNIVTQSPPYRSFPYLEYQPNLLYQTSAIYAAAIETLTSPYRLKAMKFSMGDITSVMSTYGRKEYYMTSLTPFYKPESERTLFQSAVLRGIPVNKFQKPGNCMYHSTQLEEIFGQYLNKYSASSVTTATVFNEMCSVATPFPRFFKPVVSDCGFCTSL